MFSHIPLPEFIWSVDWFCACTMYIFINILFTTEIPQGPYKAHWVTEGNVMSYSKDIACIDVKRRSRWWWKWWSQWSCCFRHDPPLLYNVEADPQELYRLTPATFSNYDEVIIIVINIIIIISRFPCCISFIFVTLVFVILYQYQKGLNDVWWKMKKAY